MTAESAPASSHHVEENGSGIKTRFTGRAVGCRLVVGANCQLEGLTVHFNAHRCVVEIGDNNIIRGDIYLNLHDGAVRIGRDNRIRNWVFMNVGGGVTIGDDCLFANVKFRSTDSHRIFDLESGERINPDMPITVGDHVWLAEDAMLLGGARVGNGSIVGARAIVTGAVPPNSLAAGIPARVIRTGIRWEE